MTPSLFHVPPRPLGASQITCIDLPPMSVRFNFPWAKNAIDCPSGDQKGLEAPSVPSTMAGSDSPNLYFQIMYLLPWSQYATIATIFPSGDSAKPFAPS